MKLLPEELIRSRPVLSVGYAWAFLDIGELEAAEAHLGDAERCLDAGPIYIDEEVFLSLPATIALARAYLSIALGDIAGTVEYARRAFALLPEQDYFRRAGAVALLGTAYLWSGDLDASWETIQEGLAIVNHLGDFSFLVSGILPLADIRNVQGHLHEAIGIYERGLQDAPEHNQPALPGTADLYLGLSSLYLEQGNLEAAVEYLARSDELGEQSGLPAWLYRMRLAQARIKEVQADLDGALVLLQEAERVFFRMPLPEFRPVGALRARIWVRQGKLTESQAWARETGLSARDEPSYPREFELITLSRVLIAEYRRKRTDRSILEAIDLLEHLLKSAEEGGRNRSMIEILVMTALAHEAQGDIPAAITSLERAVFLGEPEGYIQIFADEGPRLGELLKVLKTKWKAPGLRMGMKNYVDQLLAVLAGDSATAVEPLSTVAQPPSSAEPLSERELEVLHLLRSELDGPEIARQLGVSLTTVRTHTQNIYKKLGVNNRRAAVRRAAELGLL
jgi:LuxR family maltose regulon positive regulatory protein